MLRELQGYFVDEVYYLNLTLEVLAFPISMILILGTLITFYKLLRGSKYIRSHFISVVIITLWLLQSDAVETVLVSIMCTDKYSNDGKYRLFYDLENVCEEGRHVFYIASVSIIGCLFWLLILPLVFTTRLKQNEETYRNQSECISKSEDEKQRTFQKRYSFLYAGFKP